MVPLDDLVQTPLKVTAAGVLKHSIPGDFNLIGVPDVELLLSEVQTDVRR